MLQNLNDLQQRVSSSALSEVSSLWAISQKNLGMICSEDLQLFKGTSEVKEHIVFLLQSFKNQFFALLLCLH